MTLSLKSGMIEPYGTAAFAPFAEIEPKERNPYMEELQTAILCDGVRFHMLKDARFKRCRITAAFLTPMCKEYAADHAMLFGLLKNATRLTPSFTELGKKLALMYGAGMSDAVSKFGDCQLISIGAGGIGDPYAPDGKPIAAELAKLLCEVIFDPFTESDGLFSNAYVELEKERLADDVRAVINDKRGYALRRAMMQIARGKSCGFSRLGEEEDVLRITRESQMEAYRRLLHTAQIEILCVGNADFEPVKQQFAKALSGIKRQFSPRPQMQPLPVEPFQECREQIEIAQSRLVAAYTLHTKQDDPLLPAIRLMNAMLGGTSSSKLFLHVREEKSLCYYCGSSYDRILSLLLIDCGVERQKLNQALNAVKEQVAAIKGGGFSEEETEKARLSLINSYRSVSDSPSSLEGWYLGRLLSGISLTPAEEIARLEAVTRDEIIEAAGRMRLDTVYCLEGQDSGPESEEDVEDA